MSFFHISHFPRRPAALIVCAILAAGVMLGSLLAATAQAQEVEPSSTQRADINDLLAEDLAQATTPVSFLVVLRDQPDPATLLASAGVQAASAPSRRAELYRALTAHAERTQAPLRAWLDARGVRYTPHYLVNMIEVQGDQALADQLRLRPEVDRLARNPAVRQTESVAAALEAGTVESSYRLWPLFAAPSASRTDAGPDAGEAAGVTPTELPYGLVYTEADKAWELGVRGQGIVVGSQDTGVDWDHPALRNAYRGWNAQTQTASHPYNWFDAFGRNSTDVNVYRCSPDAQVPCDDGSHGTHTVGTMVGDASADAGTVIGMAPGAKWVGCRNMRNGVGTPSSYTTCFEWFMAPYPQGGNPMTDGKPELAPGIINNSWACPRKEGCEVDTLRQIVDTVRAAGIFVAASAGNYGGFMFPPKCNTVLEPIAIYDSSFSVGAHDQTGTIASFSSSGPVTVDGSNRLKPDLTAPGVGIMSTIPGGYSDHFSGTSMASPHVAGAVALLWSIAPELEGDIDRTEQILRESATPVINGDCDPSPTSPNNVYGYGRLNVLQAILDARPPATATVAVLGAGGQPVAALPVRLVSNQTGLTYAGVTGADGKAQVASSDGGQPLLSGAYTLQVPGCNGVVATQQVTLLPNQNTQVTVAGPVTVCRYLPQVSR
ncbi:MAG: S8 family serine peptidase [Caldilineaceae bacterium]